MSEIVCVFAVRFHNSEEENMRRILRHRPSPALVIACIALTIALGGTSYAAITLPRNSVGTAQLKTNAVNSAKVKNRSLRAIDFRRGQLPRGARGPQGAQGIQGIQGIQGPPGTPNPNAVDSDKVDGLHSNELTRVARGLGYSFPPGPLLSLTSAFQPVAQVTINVPGAGFVLINSSAGIQGSGCTTGCFIEVRLRDTNTGEVTPFTYGFVGGADGLESSATDHVGQTYVFPVSAAGARTFALDARIQVGGSVVAFSGAVTALYSPFGSTGSSVLGTAAPATSLRTITAGPGIR
jgi:hypothetical protein